MNIILTKYHNYGNGSDQLGDNEMTTRNAQREKETDN